MFKHFARVLVAVAGLAASSQALAQSMFTHQVQLKLPKGTNGMQPDLALVYDPSVGNGLVGVGWSLSGLSQITRVNYGDGIRYSGADTFAHSQLGVLVAQPDGSYRSQKETFAKVTPYGGTCGDAPCAWLVQERSGMKYYFGTAPNSRLQGLNRAYRTWGLSSVVDLFGNSWEVDYLADGNELYPNVITYTKGPGLSVYRTVVFGYEGRTDTEPGYLQGFAHATARRLKRVDVRSSVNQLRSYVLSYRSSTTTERSLLTSVQECGSDGTTCLPAPGFGWSDPPNGFAPSTWTGVDAGFGVTRNTVQGDFNGDGRTDIATFKYGAVYVDVAGASGFTQQTWSTSLPYEWAVLADADRTMLVGDINGDGLSDLLLPVGNTVYIARSTGAGFTPVEPVSLSVGLAGDWTWTGDFDGDGRTDFATIQNGEVWVLQLATNPDRYSESRWATGLTTGGAAWAGYPALSASSVFTGDFDGDGRTDLAVAQCDPPVGSYGGPLIPPATCPGHPVAVLLSTGNSFASQTWHSAGGWNSAYTWTGDFNGDGKTDLATVSGNSLIVNLSTGVGFAISAFGLPSNRGDSTSTWAADFDGDGKTDIAGISGGTLYVKFARAAGFTDRIFSIAGWDAAAIARIGDFDGDGRADLAWTSGTSWVVNRSTATNADLMTDVDNGFSGNIHVTYAPATQIATALAPLTPDSASGTCGAPDQESLSNASPRPLATQVDTDDGRGGKFVARYSYYDGRSYPGPHGDRRARNRRDLGFAAVVTTDSQTKSSVWRYFRQQPGFEGLVCRTESRAGDSSLVGRTLVSYYGLNTAPTKNAVPLKLGAGTEMVFEKETRTEFYELGGVFLFAQTTATTLFDEFGNTVEKKQSADGLETVTTTTAYANDDVKWLYGRVTGMTTSVNGVVLGDMVNVWDGNTIKSKREWLDTTKAWIVTTMGYDANGNITSVTEPGDSTRTTVTTYDPTFNAYPDTVTNALHQTTRRTYNDDGLVQTVTDRNKNVARTDYDVFGRKYLETRPDGGTTQYFYLERVTGTDGGTLLRNRAVTRVDARSQTSSQYVDGAGFVYRTEATGDAGKTIVTVSCKDAAGRPWKASMPFFGTAGADTGHSAAACSDATLSWSSKAYDAAGRTKTVTTPDGQSTTSNYGIDAAGKVYEETVDVNLKKLRRYFDSRKHVTSVVDAADQTTGYGYDALGRCTSVTLPDGSVTTTTYDSLNRKTSVTTPQAGGAITTYTYDGLNRRKTIQSTQTGAVVATFKYDDPAFTNPVGNLTTAEDLSGTAQFAYDEMGRAKTIAKKVDNNTYTHASTFDYAGRVTHLVYPDGSYVDYTYTDGGNLETVSLNGAQLARWSGYNASGKPGHVDFGNGVATDYTYDVVNHIKSVVTTKGATRLQDLSYEWYTQPNTGGVNLGSITDNRPDKMVDLGGGALNTDESQTYSYDALYRLTGADGVWGHKTYGYDGMGNPTTFQGLVARGPLTYDGQQLRSGTGIGEAIQYDSAGNMLRKVLDGTAWDYAWTFDGRLESVKKNGTLIAQMVYDADGQRVIKKYTPPTGPGVTTYYIAKTYEKRTYTDGSPERHTLNVFANGQLLVSVTRAGAVQTAFLEANRWRAGVALASMYDVTTVRGAGLRLLRLAEALGAHPSAGSAVRLALLLLFTAALLFVFLRSLLRDRRAPRVARHASLRLRWAALGIVVAFTMSACGRSPSPSGYEPFARARRGQALTGDTTSGPGVGTLYYHRNHINSSSVVTDGAGQVTARVVYLPFGELLQSSSPGADTFTTKFTGQELDEEVGLYYYNARYYDPAIGRFISPDSVVPDIVDAQQHNRYSYVRNNPIVYTDPTGHFLDFIGDAVNAIGDAIRWAANAIGAAATWAFHAVCDYYKFIWKAHVIGWNTVVGMVNSPEALMCTIMGIALTLAMGPAGTMLMLYIQSTVVAIAATSLAQAAGVTNPLVLSFIGAMAGTAAASGRTFGEFARSTASWGVGQVIQKIEGPELSRYLGPWNSLAASGVVNATGKSKWIYTLYGAIDPNFGAKLDKDKFIQWMLDNSQSQATHECAKYLRMGLEAGGLNTDGRPNYAGDYGPFLVKLGAVLVMGDNYSPGLQRGDVIVFKGEPGYEAGHIQAWTGKRFVSDYLQNNFQPYRSHPLSFEIYRFF